MIATPYLRPFRRGELHSPYIFIQISMTWQILIFPV